MVEIKYVPYGVANRFGDTIELNAKLKDVKWQKLHDQFLAHELQHTETKYNMEDLKLDLVTMNSSSIYYDYIKFLLKTPSAWIQFSPVYPTPHGRYIDYSRIISYTILIGLCYMIYKIGGLLI